jgi:predicted DNA-binding helix-hairpin-helix protein
MLQNYFYFIHMSEKLPVPNRLIPFDYIKKALVDVGIWPEKSRDYSVEGISKKIGDLRYLHQRYLDGYFTAESFGDNIDNVDEAIEIVKKLKSQLTMGRRGGINNKSLEKMTADLVSQLEDIKTEVIEKKAKPIAKKRFFNRR